MTFLALALIGVGASNAFAADPPIASFPFNIADRTVTDGNNSGRDTGLKAPPCDFPTNGTTANPVAVGGGGACKQIDPNGNTQELGPENGDHTKIGVIHNAHIKESFKQQGQTIDCLTPTNSTPPLPAGCYQGMLGTTNPNANVDLNATWIQSYIDPVSKHVFLYFAWRRDSTSGSGLISLELQRARAGGARDNCVYDSGTFNSNNCNPWGGRKPGDILFLWDQQGGSTGIVQAVFTQGPIPPQPPTAEQLGYIRSNINVPDCSHTAECTLLNDAQAFAVYGVNCGDGFQPSQCGEMVIDLTAVGVFPDPNNASAGQCTTIANFIPGTVTGNSNTADYKDVVLAPFPPVSNCGSLKVTKVTLDPGNNQIISPLATIFGYTVTRSLNAALRFPLDNPKHPEDGVTSTSSSLTQIIRPNTNVTPSQPGLYGCQKGVETPPAPCGGAEIIHTELIAGADYNIIEHLIPGPWIKVKIECTVAGGTPKEVTAASPTFTVDLDKETLCVITNRLNPASPLADSYQQVMVQDSVRILGVMKGGTSNTGAGVLDKLTVKVYLFEGGCGVNGTIVTSFDRTLTVHDPGPESATVTLYTNGFTPGFAVVQDKTYQWAIRWDGDTFNNGMSPFSAVPSRNTCNAPATGPAPVETVSIDFTPNQGAAPPNPGPPAP